MVVPLILAAASLILSGFSFIFCFAYLKRRTGQERILGEFREEVDKLILDINEATDRDAALVEDRVKTLRTLLEDMDKRITVYSREAERRRTQDDVYVELGRLRSPIASSGPEPFPSRPSALETALRQPLPAASPPASAQEQAEGGRASAEGGRSPAEGSRSLAAAQSAALTQAAPSESNGRAGEPAGPRIIRSSNPIEPKPLPFAERVAELYRAGFSSNLIAARLEATLAEVDLAIALAERRGLQENSS
jgi:hypothetical protein